MYKFFRDASLTDKKRKELTSGPLSFIINEQFKLMDSKEKNHLNYMRFLESLLIKIDQITKSFK